MIQFNDIMHKFKHSSTPEIANEAALSLTHMHEILGMSSNVMKFNSTRPQTAPSNSSVTSSKLNLDDEISNRTESTETTSITSASGGKRFMSLFAAIIGCGTQLHKRVQSTSSTCSEIAVRFLVYRIEKDSYLIYRALTENAKYRV